MPNPLDTRTDRTDFIPSTMDVGGKKTPFIEDAAKPKVHVCNALHSHVI